MDYLRAIEKEIEKRQPDESSGLDTWDRAELEYLQDIRNQLRGGASPQAVCERLQADLPQLEEQVAAEEACYTFDWYDDHYYEKIYSGQLKACRIALELYEKSR